MASWDIPIQAAFTCSEDEAAKRTRALLDDFQASYASSIKSVTWSADNRTAKLAGKGFDGEVTILPGCVDGGIKLGMLLKPLKGRIEEGIRKRITQAFG